MHSGGNTKNNFQPRTNPSLVEEVTSMFRLDVPITSVWIFGELLGSYESGKRLYSYG